MGQSQSQQSPSAEPVVKPSLSTSTTASSHRFRAKKYLTRIELASLQYVFNQLKSTFAGGFTCIEPKQFLEHLNLPSQVEPAGVLLYKSFLYLGSYPSCTAVANPVPLSFDAFITAFVILTGKLDHDHDRHHLLAENMFFTSLSVLPAPLSAEEPREEALVKEEEEDVPVERLSRGLSLAELGVDFSEDVDFNAKEQEPETKQEDILCRDLTELFILLLWLGESDKENHDFNSIQSIANSIVNHLSSQKLQTDQELPCISHQLFSDWKNQFSPHLFKPIKSFIEVTFGYIESKERLLPQDKVPKHDHSDILTSIYATMISWTLPEQILITKQWIRLYSANKDGFSMNRFESHVFKYPGPTLLIVQADAIIDKKGKTRQSITLGAYINQPWKNSKQSWGTNECYLFELSPHFDIYRSAKRENKHYLYYHHDFGVGFGATRLALPHVQKEQGGFILSLQNTLQQGIYENELYPAHSTYTPIKREFCYTFDTDNIEVFGLGNEKDRLNQAQEWKFEKQEAERRARVNIRHADGQLDKELLKMAGIIDMDARQDR